jgi:sRNA-binding regulator protein Hfq
LFTTFFLNAQKETQVEVEKNAEITIYLMNLEKISFNIESFDVTEDVLIVKFIFKTKKK